MRIFNNTQNEIGYNIASSTNADCGTIEAQQTAEFASWNETDNVKLTFNALPPEPHGLATPFTVTIPQSGTGMAVTIRLFIE
jgi:hypothetical protein